jgi:8-oxo-dGTP pyrophosphatase MutT (NUDIX family)
MKNYNFCNNCGKSGHLYHQCKIPITSIGIIVFRPSSNGIQYLMIRRKDSLGYVDFMRGRYPIHNKEYLMNIINEMTLQEKNKLLNKKFEQLWSELWGEDVGIQYRGEEKTSREKMNILKQGVILGSNKLYYLHDLLEQSKTNWVEPEWGFPKGRRNYQEKDLECALREWEEETGYSRSQIKIINNLVPFEEIFTGSNYKSYKHKYYLAYMDDDEPMSEDFQRTEVSKIDWLSLQECLDSIRPYNLEKKEVITKINRLLQEYRLYS